MEELWWTNGGEGQLISYHLMAWRRRKRRRRAGNGSALCTLFVWDGLSNSKEKWR
jgi:hypothetical protein